MSTSVSHPGSQSLATRPPNGRGERTGGYRGIRFSQARRTEPPWEGGEWSGPANFRLMGPYLAAVLSGALLWACFPPLDLGWLAFVAPAPMLWACRRSESVRAAIAVGAITGLVFFGAMLLWISVLGVVAWIPLTIVLAAYTAAYAMLVWAFRLLPAGRWWILTIAGFGLMEFVRARFPFSGFPWGSLGFAAAGSPGFLGSVQWIGDSGWGLLAVAVAAGVVLVVEDTEHWRLLVDPLVVVLLLVLGGGLFPPSADGNVMRVAIVQGNSPCPAIHCVDENRLIFESHLALTRSIEPGTVDLVVWPENSLGTPFEPVENRDVNVAIMTEARRLDAAFLVSGTRTVDEATFRNANFFYAPTGSLLGEYEKRHPVPFGEFVPLRSVFGFVPQLDRVPRDMVRGDGPVMFSTDQAIVGSLISFEGAFTRYLRQQAAAGAQVIVLATNESSFGSGAASDQLIDMVRVGAAAIGQDVVHSAITGKSAFIGADGAVGETTGLFEARVLYGEVRQRIGGPTLYTSYGDWLLILVVAAAAIAVVLPGGRRPDRTPAGAAMRSLLGGQPS